MITEALGIPSGLNDEATRVSKILIDELSNYDLPHLSGYNSINQNVSVFKMPSIKIDVNIKDLFLPDIDFEIDYYLIDGYNEPKPSIMEASYNRPSDLVFVGDSPYFSDMIEHSKFSVKIVMSPHLYNKTDTDDVIELLDKELSIILSHELKHLYDTYKKKTTKMYKTSDYRAISTMMRDMEFVNKFAYLLYYTTNIENLVRPSEIYQMMILKKVKKSEFIDFIKNTDVIETLTKAENFSVKDFENEIKEIRKKDRSIDFTLNSLGVDGLKYIMLTYLSELTDNISENMNRYMFNEMIKCKLLNPSDGIKKIKESEEKVNKFIDTISKKVNKLNVDSYFKEVEHRLNTVGRKLKRKLYKLYDLALDDENIKKTDYFKKNEIYKFSEYTKIINLNEKNK